MQLLNGLRARLFLIVFMGCCAAVAQQDDGVRGVAGTTRNGGTVTESLLVAGPGLQMGTPVKGQPYSAEQVSEHVQTLTNGTHIDQKREASRMYRDSEGRTRTERLMLQGVAERTGAKDSLRLIHIYDPVDGYAYTLDTQKHIAHRYTVPIPSESQKAVRPVGVLTPLAAGQPLAGKAASVNRVLGNGHMKRTSLGTDVIDGIQVEGTRTTITTPAGVMGNDRPLTRICDVWHSEELKITMLSKCTDPRSGNSTLRLQNLERSEPDAELFQVPADYTIVEEQGRFTLDFGGPQGR